MKSGNQFVIAAAAAAVFAAGAVMAQQATQPGQAPSHGPGHDAARHEAMMRGGMGPMGMGMGRGPVGMLTSQDDNSGVDMGIAMNLVHENTKIRRTVTRLPDGIRTLTESDDPRIAQDIKTHVASMSGRLVAGREFNIFSTTLPVIFDNAKNIESTVEYTEKGALVTRTSKNRNVVRALQAHADEVSELVKEGPVAFHRGIDARMAMGPGGPRGSRASSGGSPPSHRHQQ